MINIFVSVLVIYFVQPMPAVFGASNSEVQEKEYDAATVLLIDTPTNMLGISFVDEKTKKEEKHSFKIDPKTVYVTNQLNQYLEFSNIQVGDYVDVSSQIDAAGTETVVEIVDYNRFNQEELEAPVSNISFDKK